MSNKSKTRFYGLEKRAYVRSLAWQCDFDEYSFPLDQASKEWLNTFAEAELKGTFRFGHTYTQEEKRAIWRTIDHKKNDLYSVQACSNMIDDLESIIDNPHNNRTEELIVSLIDYEAEIKLKASKKRKCKIH